MNDNYKKKLIEKMLKDYTQLKERQILRIVNEVITKEEVMMADGREMPKM